MDGVQFVCSVTGKPCACRDTSRCVARLEREVPAEEAQAAAFKTHIQFAQSAIISAQLSLKEAEGLLIYERPHPGPELREAIRRLGHLDKELQALIKAAV